ncbi:unnamed protein product [Prorocentrum cordatum]|uniref:Subtilisin n=1 Tax=Prorocentrum cordatum TaxID=2364126 RepID=A0ABN9WY00_9DINO|nr:unnamed protein product [Polarella glacialis]
MGGGATLDTLFGSFDVVSGTSGGAWFESQLAYSEQFEDLVYKMAKVPAKAGELMNAEWYARALGFGALRDGSLQISTESLQCLMQLISQVDPAVSALAEELLGPALSAGALAPANDSAAAAPGSGLPVSALEGILATAREKGVPEIFVEYIISAVTSLAEVGVPLTWTRFVEVMNDRTAGISPAMTLGSRTNSWAEGKEFLYTVTLPVPQPKRLPLQHNFTDKVNPLEFGGFGLPNFTEVAVFNPPGEASDLFYTVQTSETHLAANLLPARFSYSVRSGVELGGESAPMTFCGDPSCFGTSLHYAQGSSGDSAESGPLGTQFNLAFETNVSSLPIGPVSAASSAFQWVMGVTGFDATQSCFDLAVWVDGSPNGKAFSGGEEVRAELFASGSGSNVTQGADSPAQAGLLALGDGGNLDVTGLVNAVAAGASRVTVLLSTDLTNTSLTHAYRDLTNLFPRPGNNPVRVICAEPPIDQVEGFVETMKRIPAQPDTEFLSAVAHGTLECTTVQNPWFGIEAGQRITLDVVSVESVNVTIGLPAAGYSFGSFFDYGRFLGEVVATLTAEDNREDVEAVIARYFNHSERADLSIHGCGRRNGDNQRDLCICVCASRLSRRALAEKQLRQQPLASRDQD